MINEFNHERYQYVVIPLPKNPIILGDLLRLYRHRSKRNLHAMKGQGDYRNVRDDLANEGMKV